jgi:hypothetical protein
MRANNESKGKKKGRGQEAPLKEKRQLKFEAQVRKGGFGTTTQSSLNSQTRGYTTKSVN